MNSTPQAPLESPSQEPRSLWKPIGITILGSFVIALGSCAGGAALGSGPLKSISVPLIWIGFLFELVFLGSLIAAVIYFFVTLFFKR